MDSKIEVIMKQIEEYSRHESVMFKISSEHQNAVYRFQNKIIEYLADGVKNVPTEEIEKASSSVTKYKKQLMSIEGDKSEENRKRIQQIKRTLAEEESKLECLQTLFGNYGAVLDIQKSLEKLFISNENTIKEEYDLHKRKLDEIKKMFQ